MSAAVAWILSLLLYAAPPDRLDAMPGWTETPAARAARYQSIAEDVAAVVYAPGAIVLYGGPRARAHTAALLVAVAVLESGLAADVDLGPCYRGRDGRSARCDRGRARCILQVHDARAEGNRRECIRIALRLMRGSFGLASGMGRDRGWDAATVAAHRLDIYAGTGPAAHRLGAARLALADRLAGRPGAPRDAEALSPPAARETAAQGAP